MKLLNQYTDEELLAISVEEKQQIFLLECATRGVLLPQAVPEYINSPEKAKEMEPDKVLYKVSADWSVIGYCKTIEEAKNLADLITKTMIKFSSIYTSGHPIHYEDGNIGEVKVEADTVYSKDKYTQLKSALTTYATNEDSIKKNNQRRQEILNQHEDIMSEIDDAIRKADFNITKVKELKGTFSEYLKMANKDHDVAVRFMLNVHYADVIDYPDNILTNIGLSSTDIQTYQAGLAEEQE